MVTTHPAPAAIGKKLPNRVFDAIVTTAGTCFSIVDRMVLSLKQYNHLHTEQKAVLVCAECKLVDMDLKKEVIYTLYAYSSFFVEVRVNHKTKQLIDIRAFRNGKKLDRYLNKIDLREMING